MIAAQIAEFASNESLPPAFIDMALQWYYPLAQEIADRVKTKEIKIIGVSGTQGSGKSTLANLLQHLLNAQNLTVVSLSLDDFYLTRAERQQLAQSIHPLLITRGVPGTHDIELANNTIKNLIANKNSNVPIPRFDKANDDRFPNTQWDNITAPVDLIIFEGWCLGVPPQTESALEQPVNILEQDEDADGTWRHFVNNALIAYQDFFKQIDYLIYLQSPDFGAVKRWRGRQEEKLAAKTKTGSGTKIMDETALNRFLQHYQRLTEHGFKTLPNIANVIFTLNNEQQITQRLNRG